MRPDERRRRPARRSAGWRRAPRQACLGGQRRHRFEPVLDRADERSAGPAETAPSASAQARSSRCTASRRPAATATPCSRHRPPPARRARPGRAGRRAAAASARAAPAHRRRPAPACAGSRPSTSRSRKPPPPARASRNRRSIGGVSHTRRAARRAPTGRAPARRRCARPAARPSRASRPVPIATAPRRVATTRRDRPAAGRADGASRAQSAPAIDLAQLGAAQAAAGREKRHGLQQIGLAGAVRAGQHHRPGTELEPRRAVVAEIGQHQPRHADAAAAAPASLRAPVPR